MNRWWRLSHAWWTLGMDASSVIGLRAATLAAGGAAAKREARRMVDEKVKAALALQALALTGSLGRTPHGTSARTIAHYRKAVRANRRRLLKKAKRPK
jgi:hypothetical protein